MKQFKLICALSITIFAFSILTVPSWAQQTTPAGSGTKQVEEKKGADPTQEDQTKQTDQTAEKERPAYQAYVNKKKRYRAIDEEINSIFGNLSFGVRDKQKAQMAKGGW